MKPTTAFAPLTGNDIESWASGMGLKLDAVQLAVLDPGIRRGILNCCRKFGKSMTIAFKAAHFAYSRPNTTVLVVAAAARQSEELLATIGRILRRYVSGCSYSRVRIDLPNGSRILALPHQPETIRGYSPELVVVDEAAYVDDDLWEAVFPMLNAAEGGGWLWLLSTPAQPAGFFHRIWTDTSANWTRVKVAAPDCARIPARMIEEARRSMPVAEFAREYLCEFAQPATAAFEEPLVQACLDPTLTDFFTTHLQYPLPAAPRRARPHAYVGVDLGRQQDHSAMAIVEFVTEPTGSVHAETRAALFRCSLTLRHLEMPALGTPYTDVAQRVLTMARHPRLLNRCTLVVDAGGVGRPVVDMMKRPPVPAPIVPVTITGGREVGEGEDGFSVPKPLLMDRLEHAMRARKLRIAGGPLTSELFRQLQLLEREVGSSGYVTYSMPTSTVHDDLVMALALAVWRAWEEHQYYLEMDGPVPIVSDVGMLHETVVHPLLRGSHTNLPALLRLGGVTGR